jgi:hypothetical protein
VLIGMPGIEKRIARFPQFYSRIGFVHEFRPLAANQVQELLAQRWAPAGIKLPDGPLSPEVVASLIRMTGGNFRLHHQFERFRTAMNFYVAYPHRGSFRFESVYLGRIRDAALGNVYGMVHRQARHVPAIGDSEQKNLQVDSQSCEKRRNG